MVKIQNKKIYKGKKKEMAFAWYNHNMYDTIFVIQYMIILLCQN